MDKNDYQNLLALLNRVDLKGSEATSVAVLQQKLTKLLSEQPVEEKEKEKK